MNESAAPIVFIALSPFIFVGMWCAICLLLSTMGGWRRLAERFPAKSEPSGRRFSMQGGKVGMASYNGCLTIHASRKGLHLSVWLLFRPGHPPLFIPWDAIHNATTRRFLWTESVVFDIGSPRIATLQLPKQIFDGHNIV